MSWWKSKKRIAREKEAAQIAEYEELKSYEIDEVVWRANKSNYRIVKEYDGYAVEYNKPVRHYCPVEGYETFLYHKEDDWVNTAPVSPDDIVVDGERQLDTTFTFSSSASIIIGDSYRSSNRGYSTQEGHYFETLEEAQMSLEISLELYKQNLGRERFKKEIVEEY